jgi:hypothetical protein
MSETFWNGEPTPAKRVVLRLEGDGGHPAYWAREAIGSERDAVRVEYGDAVFYLDNADGSGWRKVTEGRGSPRWPDRSLYGTVVRPSSLAAVEVSD